MDLNNLHCYKTDRNESVSAALENSRISIELPNSQNTLLLSPHLLFLIFCCPTYCSHFCPLSLHLLYLQLLITFSICFSEQSPYGNVALRLPVSHLSSLLILGFLIRRKCLPEELKAKDALELCIQLRPCQPLDCTQKCLVYLIPCPCKCGWYAISLIDSAGSAPW